MKSFINIGMALILAVMLGAPACQKAEEQSSGTGEKKPQTATMPQEPVKEPAAVSGISLGATLDEVMKKAPGAKKVPDQAGKFTILVDADPGELFKVKAVTRTFFFDVEKRLQAIIYNFDFEFNGSQAREAYTHLTQKFKAEFGATPTEVKSSYRSASDDQAAWGLILKEQKEVELDNKVKELRWAGAKMAITLSLAEMVPVGVPQDKAGPRFESVASFSLAGFSQALEGK
ncbi:MAG: hypothetical protein HQK58_09960 [Deltaproteobacteria bacterium]|nr:hypothetical protein [Deltaproteobacteria bacterium]